MALMSYREYVSDLGITISLSIGWHCFAIVRMLRRFSLNSVVRLASVLTLGRRVQPVERIVYVVRAGLDTIIPEKHFLLCVVNTHDDVVIRVVGVSQQIVYIGRDGSIAEYFFSKLIPGIVLC
jgi:hypothetical protein